MPNFLDLTNTQIGRWTVIKISGRAPSGGIMWLCQCSCGIKKRVCLTVLRQGSGKGCVRCANTTHGFSYKDEYKTYKSAKAHAKRCGIPFKIVPSDISIPKKCPLLGIPLKRGKGCASSNSPSLDRINPKKGYTPNNIWVISNQANLIKQDVSLYTLQKLVKNLERKLKRTK